jgi:hypothetical protein
VRSGRAVVFNVRWPLTVVETRTMDGGVSYMWCRDETRVGRFCGLYLLKRAWCAWIAVPFPSRSAFARDRTRLCASVVPVEETKSAPTQVIGAVIRPRLVNCAGRLQSHWGQRLAQPECFDTSSIPTLAKNATARLPNVADRLSTHGTSAFSISLQPH